MATTKAKGSFKQFDIDLEFGQHWEEHIDDLFKGVKTCEVKTERDKWAKTGNICIELESWGKPSGINATTSDIWVQNLVKDDRLLASIMIPTDVLKEVMEDLPQRTVMGGDNMSSKLLLVSLTKLMEVLKGKE
jgi:hypothetical protein